MPIRPNAGEECERRILTDREPTFRLSWFVSSHSQKVVRGTTRRLSGRSHRHQCGEVTLRIFVTPVSGLPWGTNCGEGMPPPPPPTRTKSGFPILQRLACAGPARASGHTDGAAQGACTDLRACRVVGELALGSLRERDAVLAFLTAQREAVVATHAEVMTVIDRHSIFSMGIGYTDAHLLTSTLLDRRSSLWTRDKRLAAAARKVGAALYPSPHIPH